MPKFLRPLDFQCTVHQRFGENANNSYANTGLKGHTGSADESCGYGSEVKSYVEGYVYAVHTPEKPASDGYTAVYMLCKTPLETFEFSVGHLSRVDVSVGQYVKEGDVIGLEGNCFDKETEILTENGWKLFKDLNKNEKVMTLNPETNNIEYHKPDKYVKKKTSKMYSYRTDGNDFVVSADHSMYVNTSPTMPNNYHFSELQDLPKWSAYKRHGGIWEGNEEKYFIIPEYKYTGDRWGTQRISKEIKVDMDDWLWFLGIWLSDGWLNNGKTKFAGITQSFNNPEKRLKIDAIVDKLPFHVNRNGEDYRIQSRQIYECLKQWGKKDSKVIPSFIKELSPRQIKIFLDGYKTGDGWEHRSSTYYIFGDKKMADDIQHLLCLIGSSGSIKEYCHSNREKKPVINGQVINSQKPFWLLLEQREKRGSIRKEKIKEIDYDDFTYCVTVQNHIIYVRRNGYPMWCGNSGTVYSGGQRITLAMQANGDTRGSHRHVQKRVYREVDTVRMYQHYLHDAQGIYKTPEGKYCEVVDYYNGYNGCVDFTKPLWKRDLFFGVSGYDVELLQKALVQLGYGDFEPTGFYGVKTTGAVARYQKEAGLTPAVGYFGVKSRQALNANFNQLT